MTPLERLHGKYVHGRRVRRIAARAAEILPEHVRTVLDLGCGDGRLGHRLSLLRPGLAISGADPLVRPDALIPVHRCDGAKLPFPDAHFDAVLIVDVLHHTTDPVAVLREAARVARLHVLIKDHLLSGFAALATLRFMDEVGNRRHGVALPHNYLDAAAWNAAYAASDLQPLRRDGLADLYPWPASLVFGRRLHFMELLRKRGQAEIGA